MEDIDAQTNQVIISLSKMLPDGKSVISLDRTLDDIQVITEEINLNGNGYGFVMDKSGMIVAHSDKNQRGNNYLTDESLQDSDMNDVVHKIMQGSGENFKMVIDGKKSMVFLRNWSMIGM